MVVRDFSRVLPPSFFCAGLKFRFVCFLFFGGSSCDVCRDHQVMGNRYLEIFQGKRSDYYAAIASVSNIPSIGRFVCPFILFTFSSSWRYTAFFGGGGWTDYYLSATASHARCRWLVVGRAGRQFDRGERGSRRRDRPRGGGRLSGCLGGPGPIGRGLGHVGGLEKARRW